MNIKQLLIAASISIGLFPSIAAAAPAIVTGGTKAATLNVTAKLVDPAPIVVNGSINLAGPLDFGTVTLPTTGTKIIKAATTFTVTVDNTMPYTIAIPVNLNAIFGQLTGATTGRSLNYFLEQTPVSVIQQGVQLPANFSVWGNGPVSAIGTGLAQPYYLSMALGLDSGDVSGVPTLADTYTDTRIITLTY